MVSHIRDIYCTYMATALCTYKNIMYQTQHGSLKWVITCIEKGGLGKCTIVTCITIYKKDSRVVKAIFGL